MATPAAPPTAAAPAPSADTRLKSASAVDLAPAGRRLTQQRSDPAVGSKGKLARKGSGALDKAKPAADSPGTAASPTTAASSDGAPSPAESPKAARSKSRRPPAVAAELEQAKRIHASKRRTTVAFAVPHAALSTTSLSASESLPSSGSARSVDGGTGPSKGRRTGTSASKTPVGGGSSGSVSSSTTVSMKAPPAGRRHTVAISLEPGDSPCTPTRAEALLGEVGGANGGARAWFVAALVFLCSVPVATAAQLRAGPSVARIVVGVRRLHRLRAGGRPAVPDGARMGARG